MLRIIHNYKGTELELGLTVDGDYIDVYPLFKLAVGKRKVKTFMKDNTYRARYLMALEGEVGQPCIRSRVKPKGYMYHIKLVKVLLYSLDMLEYDHIIALAWVAHHGNRTDDHIELPMLTAYQFDHRVVMLSYRTSSGAQSEPVPMRLVRRRCDGWMNLTMMMAEYDGRPTTGAKKSAGDAAKGKTTLMRRLYKLSHTPEEIAALEERLDSKDAEVKKKAIEALIAMYVCTSFTSNETWVEPNVFYDVLIDLSINFHEIMTQCLTRVMFSEHANIVTQMEGQLAAAAKKMEIKHDPKCADAEYVSPAEKAMRARMCESELLNVRHEQVALAAKATETRRTARLYGVEAEVIRHPHRHLLAEDTAQSASVEPPKVDTSTASSSLDMSQSHGPEVKVHAASVMR
jgi:hypothetical protein